jgi:hypothetical protein
VPSTSPSAQQFVPAQPTPQTAQDAGSILGAEIAAMVARERDKAERKTAQASARAVRAAARAAARAIPPERSDQFTHLSLDGMRTYRQLVVREEERVGYWQRVVTARLDALNGIGADVDTDHLRPALESQQLAAGREVVVGAAHAILPPLPTLDALWLAAEDPTALARVTETGAGLTAYREGLAEQVRAATHELIARYRQTPGACLTALPA